MGDKSAVSRSFSTSFTLVGSAPEADERSLSVDLREKILSKQAHLGVIGMGYVGLPLMVEFAKAGFSVTGIDVSEDKEIYVEANTGREVIKETQNVVGFYDWVPSIECWPYPKIGEWLETWVRQ